MSLKRAASLGIVQSAVSVACSFISVKITSVYLGPAGIGLLGQLQNFMTLSQGIVGAGLNTAVVRRTAQFGGDPQARARPAGACPSGVDRDAAGRRGRAPGRSGDRPGLALAGH
jgi:hypothetical protein